MRTVWGIHTNPYANHGAGIFTYKTGRFCSGKCWCAYSSTMVRIWVTKHSQFFANGCYISGWWYTYFSEKYQYEFVSWDKIIPNIWKVINSCSKPPTRPMGVIYGFLKMQKKPSEMIPQWLIRKGRRRSALLGLP